MFVIAEQMIMVAWREEMRISSVCEALLGRSGEIEVRRPSLSALLHTSCRREKGPPSRPTRYEREGQSQEPRGVPTATTVAPSSRRARQRMAPKSGVLLRTQVGRHGAHEESKRFSSKPV